MALGKGSKHAVHVRRAAAKFSSPAARELLIPSRGDSFDLNGRTDLLKGPSALLALSRPHESVLSDPETPIALSNAWVEVSEPRRAPRVEPDRFQAQRMRQIMVERIAGARAENLRDLRSLTRFLGVSGMVLRCLERKARREVLHARARLEYMEGRGNGRVRPLKRHWRRSYYSLIGC